MNIIIVGGGIGGLTLALSVHAAVPARQTDPQHSSQREPEAGAGGLGPARTCLVRMSGVPQALQAYLFRRTRLQNLLPSLTMQAGTYIDQCLVYIASCAGGG